MAALVWGGALVSVAGLAGLAYCILRVARSRRRMARAGRAAGAVTKENRPPNGSRIGGTAATRARSDRQVVEKILE
ncbi:hypothetical protein [Roseivivax sp. CAU 1761]